MLTAKKTPASQTLRKRPYVVLAVLLLAALQLTNATHQIDHTANDLGDVCSFCMELERLDDIDAANSVTAMLPSVHSHCDELSQPPIQTSRRNFSQPRAPPLS